MRQRNQTAVLFWGLCLGTAAIGCEGSSSQHAVPVTTQDSGTPTKSDSPLRPDLPSNGSVEVEELGLHALEHERDVELSIPVRGLVEGKGNVIAELIAVDGSKVYATADADFALQKDEKKMLSVRLALPDDLKQQADRAAYSVRVHDDKSKLHVTRSLLYVLTPYELRLEGPSSLRADKPGSYRVRVQDPRTREPIADQAVSIDVKRGDDVVHSVKAMSDDDGSAIFAVDVAEPGAYALAVESGVEALSSDIEVREAGQNILLTTDKPLYQPGQTMHLRALALQAGENKPQAGASLLFEVSDGKGNKVFKKTLKTNDYGIASVDFKLAQLVNMGSYKLQVSGAGQSEKTVEVSRYVLPKFEVRVATDRSWYAPGDELRGTAKTLNILETG